MYAHEIKKSTKKVGNYEGKEFFITDITHFVVIRPWTFQKKHVFVKVSTHSYIILQLKCEFPVDASSYFTHLSQTFSSKTWELLTWHTGYCWNFFNERKQKKALKRYEDDTKQHIWSRKTSSLIIHFNTRKNIISWRPSLELLGQKAVLQR